MNKSTLSNRWYHGKITRENALHLLTDGSATDGRFLIRESTHKPGNYVISILIEGEPQHFQIIHHGDAWYSIDNGPVFQGLDALVSYYQGVSDGLPRTLGQPISGDAPPPQTLKRYDTNLHKAVEQNNFQHVYALLSKPKSTGLGTPNCRNEDGATPLHHACRKGYLEIVKALLECEADTSIRDSTGTTALHEAARGNHSEVIRLLVDANADVQERNASTQWVALHEAAFRGHVEACKMLLFLGAPVQPRSQEGELPRDLALRYNKQDTIDLLDYVLTNYPQSRTTTADWLHKRCDRQKAVQNLINHGSQNGAFLVRPHSSLVNQYALTVMFNKMPYHFVICCESDRVFYIDDGPLFTSLNYVIDHYMMLADGLPTRLLIPVPPAGSPPPRKSTAPPPGEILFPDLCRKKSSQAPPPVGPKPSALPSNKPPQPLPRTEEMIASMSLGPTTPKILEIPSKNLSLKDELGSGEFSSVVKAIWKRKDGTKMDVAVKKLKPKAITHGQNEFLREASVMGQLQHHCIVNFIGICKTEPIMLVQELVPYGSMLNYLYNTKSTKQQPTLSILKLWAAEIASGMVYLESMRFVHRDLAARNILIESMKQVKISDFGLSRTLGANSNYYQASQGGKWPVKWYAPESVNYGTFSSSSDVWSYGITLWEMFSYGEHPYGEWTGTQVLELIENHNYRLGKPEQCPDTIYNVMMQCWSIEPTDRPTFASLHSTLSSSDDYKGLPHSELYALTKCVQKEISSAV